MNELTVINHEPYENLDFTYDWQISQNLIKDSKNMGVASDNALVVFERDDVLTEDLIDAEFDKSVRKADKQDYIIAASSGALCAALDVFWVKDVSSLHDISALEEARDWGTDKINEFVITIARLKADYNGDDLQEAITRLEERFPLASDKVTSEMGGGLQHHLRDFSHHPSIVGLIFSLLSQFTKKGYGTDVNGKFITPDLPEDAVIGKNTIERIFYGTVVWALHLVSDMAGSSNSPGKGTGIPGPFLSLFKELSALPIMQKLTETDEKGVNEFSKQIAKWFNGTYFRDEKHPKGVRFDLRAEIGVAHEFSKQFIPIILNEVIVRSFYFIKYFSIELKNKNVKSLRDLRKLNPEKFLPFKNRIVVRMCTVASGVFTTIDVSSAAAKAAFENRGDDEDSHFVVDFLLNINYPGIGRFVFACVADSKYVCEDVSKTYKAYQERRIEDKYREGQGVQYFELSSIQAQILHSLKAQKALYDIKQTKDADIVKKKYEWCDCWQKFIIENSNYDENYFIEDEGELYSLINKELLDADSNWLYQALLELMVFDPYFPLNLEDKKKYKNLKYKAKYEEEVFCEKQSILNKDSLKKLKKTFNGYIAELKKQKEKVAGGVVATVVVTVLSGGLAWAFAPEIAIMLAGETVAGLSGAALTSASLAAIGGGSIAAGGLGMAGGTAIITGGGALLAATGSGVATVSSSLLMTSKGYALRESAKLLTFCKCILIDEYGKYEVVKKVQESIEKSIDEFQSNIDRVKESNDIDDSEKKKLIKESKESIKYLKRCNSELSKLTS